MWRSLCLSLATATALTFASLSAGVAPNVVVEVRSTDPAQVLIVDVVASGGAGFGLAVWNGAPGSVTQSGATGRGTTPLLIHVGPNAGTIRVSVPANFPALRAFVQGDTARKASGHTIVILRDSLGVSLR